MKKKKHINKLLKKKWNMPVLKTLHLKNTNGGGMAGDIEGSTYDGTLSA